MRKIKVLLLLHDLSPTGAPKVAASAFEHLKNEIDLWTISYEGGPLGSRLRALGRVQTLVAFRWPGMPASPRAVLLFLWHRFFSVLKARRWSRAVRRWQPDLIYINSVAGLLAARRLTLPAAPVLLHVHELDSFLRPLSEHMPELFLGLPDRYVAVSQAVADALIERFGVSAGKVSVIPAFVEAFALPDLTPPVRADSRLVVGGAGVISWVKGAQLWLLMAAEVKRRLGADQVRFVWVGIPDNEEGWQFHEMARKLHLTDDIEFVRFVLSPLEYFANFDIFTMTSWEETASLALLENMLLEKAVVCFAGAGGPPEFAGPAGVIVDEFSPIALADAVCALAADPARRAALGRAARQRVLENFTADIQAPRLLEEMRRLTGSE
jgi:glycosyltransferase involved in cell wall biosynthesis